jgi:hypothetical protein
MGLLASNLRGRGKAMGLVKRMSVIGRGLALGFVLVGCEPSASDVSLKVSDLRTGHTLGNPSVEISEVIDLQNNSGHRKLDIWKDLETDLSMDSGLKIDHRHLSAHIGSDGMLGPGERIKLPIDLYIDNVKFEQGTALLRVSYCGVDLSVQKIRVPEDFDKGLAVMFASGWPWKK